MTNDELQHLLAQFDEHTLKTKGFFGIHRYGGGPDESFIRANKEGLELFAIELLKSAKEVESRLNDPEKTLIPFEYDGNWIDDDSETYIQYIEPVTDKQMPQKVVHHKKSIADILIPLGCVFLTIILIVTMFVGFVTVVKWIY